MELRYSLSFLLITSLLFTACAPASTEPSADAIRTSAAQTIQAEVSPAIQATPSAPPVASAPPAASSTVEVAPTAAPASGGAGFAVNVSYAPVSFSFGSNVAASWSVEVIPQGPGSSTSAGPVDYTDPEHLVFTLGEYAVPEICANCARPAQIFIYPAVAMSQQNPVAAPRIAALSAFLASPPADLAEQSVALPFLPLFNAAQIFHAQVSFINFQNGRGVRYLTGHAQGLMSIVNAGIYYTFQGISNDGAWYIAAVLPVSNPNLSNTANEAAAQSDAFMTDPLTYIDFMAQMLNGLASNSFSPDLAALDAMIATLLVSP